jgi:dolichol-phosphate mannosyltransferase
MELTVVVPTYNERDNVAVLVERMSRALEGVSSWEVVFVDDDSPDGTNEAVRELSLTDPRVRCIRRIGRRGLSSASIEGMLSSAAEFLAVMDADLQHDETLLPVMLDTLRGGGVDIVVGSRYVEGGSVGRWDKTRSLISRMGTNLGRLVIRADLKDPMSGFFMLRRELLERTVHGLSARGFKILLDIFATAGGKITYRELPFTFRSRHAGQSKLDTLTFWEYLLLLAEKTLGGYVPIGYLTWAGGMALAVVLHMLTLHVLHISLGLGFVLSQSGGALVSALFVFGVSDYFVGRRFKRGAAVFLKGMAGFAAAALPGLVYDVGAAALLDGADAIIAVSRIQAGLCGAVTGVLWCYLVVSTFSKRSGLRNP